MKTNVLFYISIIFLNSFSSIVSAQTSNPYLCDPESPPLNFDCDHCDEKKIFDWFESHGFIKIKIKVIEDLPAVLKDSVSVRNSEVYDFAHVVFRIDDLLVDDLEGEYNDFFNSVDMSFTENLAYITDNDYICLDYETLGDLDSKLIAADVGMWAHIWRGLPTSIPGEYHCEYFFYKLYSKEINYFNKLWNIFDDCVEVNNWDLQNASGQPNHSFSVYQRCFGPWKNFGHFPVRVTFDPLPIEPFELKNRFCGDHRGFSLFPHTDKEGGEVNKVS